MKLAYAPLGLAALLAVVSTASFAEMPRTPAPEGAKV